MYGFKSRKAAQVAAFFALREGGSINVLKLAKLMYLTEREAMKRFDEPMFFDRLVSMDHGPVASISLNLINGLSSDPDWSPFISGRDNYQVIANADATITNLDELSKADILVLESLWSDFGDFDGFSLRDWTHKNCPEWEDPDGSSKPISHELVYKFLEKPDASTLSDHLVAYRRLAALI